MRTANTTDHALRHCHLSHGRPAHPAPIWRNSLCFIIHECAPTCSPQAFRDFVVYRDHSSASKYNTVTAPSYERFARVNTPVGVGGWDVDVG